MSDYEEDIEDINEVLQTLSDIVMLQNQQLESLNVALRNQTKATVEVTNFSKQQIFYRLSRTNIFLQEAVGAIRAGIAKSDELQRQSLGANQNLTDIIGKNTEAIEKMPGGFGQAVEVRMNQVLQGIVGYSQNLTELGAEQRATNQGFVMTTRIARRQMLLGGLTIDAIDDLTGETRNLSKTYGIQTSKLIGSLSQLDSRLSEFNLLGLTSQMSKATQEITAQLGVGSETLVGRALNFLTSPDMQSFRQAQLLGISDLRSQIVRGQADTDTIREAIIRAGTNFENIVNQFTAGGIDPSIQLGILENIYGVEARFLSVIAKQLKDTNQIDERTLEISREFNESLSVLHQEFVEPLQMFVMTQFPKVVNFLADNKELLKGIAAAAVATLAIRKAEKLTPLIAGAGGFLGLGQSQRTLQMVMDRGLKRSVSKLGLGSFLVRLAGPIGMLVGLATLIPDFLAFFDRDEQKFLQDQTDAATQAAEARIARDQQRTTTNRALELQSQTLNATLQSIMMNQNTQDRMKSLNAEQVELLSALLGELQRANGALLTSRPNINTNR